jgi:hypothetical protein
MLHDLVRKLTKAYLPQAGMTDKADCNLQARSSTHGGLKIGGVFDVVCRDREGNIKWQESIHNIWVNSGLEDLLDVYFKNGTKTATWYVGLYTNANPSATWIATTDLTEFTSYSGSRKEWTEGSITGTTTKSLDNSASKASFAISGSGTIVGAFLCKGATGAQNICCASNFGTSRSVADGDTVEVTYTCQAKDDETA